MNNEENNIQDVNNALNIGDAPQELVAQQTVVSQEQKVQKEPNKKNGKGKTIVIIILLLMVLGLGGYIGYDKFLNNTQTNNTEPDCTKCNVNENKEENKTSDNNNSIVSNKVINFDRSKCINADLTDNKYKIENMGMPLDFNGISFTIDNNKVNLNVRYDVMYPNNYKEGDDTYDTVTIEFNKNVNSIYGGWFSDDSANGAYIFLLEDGTLEYMKISDIYHKKILTKHYPINGVEDIVTFNNIAIQDTTKEIGGTRYTAIAYKMDGTYYDLSKFIENLYD